MDRTLAEWRSGTMWFSVLTRSVIVLFPDPDSYQIWLSQYAAVII